MISGMIFQFYKDRNLTSAVSVVLIIVSILILCFSLYIKKKFGKMYQSLYYREELFHSLCTNIDDIIIIYHFGRHQIEYVSPNLERIYGINSHIFKKNPFILISHANVRFRNDIKELFTTNIVTTNHEVEFSLFHPKNKKLSTLLLRIYPVMTRQTVIRYIISISDLTKEKETQQMLKEALMSAQKANEAKKDFLSHMSHEIRTPLNAINGMAQIAAKVLDDRQKVENCLEKITDASKKLIELVNNILDMSKIDSNKLILSHEPFQFKEVITGFSDIMKAQADQYLLRYELTIKNVVHNNLMGDTLRLLQVLGNCISNSLKFTSAGGNIRLEIEEQSLSGDKAIFRFIISDTGMGMSEEYIERLFIPFEQEDSTIARKYGGTGLGMSITKNLVNLMSGDIHVSSKVGTGTTITIHIPFDVMEKAEVIETTVSESTLPEYDFSGAHVLVIEDNDVNMEVITEFLRYVRINPDTVKSARDAIRLFEASEPFYYNIILADIQMPEMNGYEAARRLRESSRPDAGSVCIIAMSADSFTEDVSRSLDSGMNYHIPKPVEMEQLYQLFNKILSKKEG